MSSVFGFGRRNPPPPPQPLPIPLSEVKAAAAQTVAWARHVNALLDADIADSGDLVGYPETERGPHATDERPST